MTPQCHTKKEQLGSGNKCLVPGYKRGLVQKAEKLIVKEPLKPWITFERNIKNVKYLTTMPDINLKERYVYVDVGAPVAMGQALVVGSRNNTLNETKHLRYTWEWEWQLDWIDWINPKPIQLKCVWFEFKLN